MCRSDDSRTGLLLAARCEFYGQRLLARLGWVVGSGCLVWRARIQFWPGGHDTRMGSIVMLPRSAVQKPDLVRRDRPQRDFEYMYGV